MEDRAAVAVGIRVAKMDIFRNILAAGPLTKQPGTRAFRVVIRLFAYEISVHNQIFPEWPRLDNAEYAEGDYFRLSQLAEATARFAERVRLSAPCIGSIYREPLLD